MGVSEATMGRVILNQDRANSSPDNHPQVT